MGDPVVSSVLVTQEDLLLLDAYDTLVELGQTDRILIMGGRGPQGIQGIPGPSSDPIKTVFADYQAIATDHTIIADATDESIEITLTASPSAKDSFNIAVLDSTNTVQINFNGQKYYKDLSNKVLFREENLTLHFSGSEWVGK